MPPRSSTRKARQGDEKGARGPAIFQEVYDLILLLYQVVRGFPKSQQFVLGQRIEQTAVTILGGIVEANSSEEKLPHLRQVSVELEKLRVFVRLAKDLRFVSFGGYEALSLRVDTIGRMLGGWTKWAAEREAGGGGG